MKKNKLLTLTILALSLAFIGTYATTARSQLPPLYQGLPTGSMSETFRHPDCPNTTSSEVSVKYPINTGNAKVDAFIELKAAEIMAKQTSIYGKFVPDECKTNIKIYSHSEYKSFKPNPDTLGVIINTREYGGGNHVLCENLTYNFDLRTGRQIQIKDFFIDPRIGINGIYKFAYADFCNKPTPTYTQRRVLGGVCGSDRNAPRELLALSGSLDDLGHIVLTERGVDLNFCAWEIWSVFLGDYTISIPKNSLIKFGARDFWGPSIPKF
jgi:hypothetical protein